MRTDAAAPLQPSTLPPAEPPKARRRRWLVIAGIVAVVLAVVIVVSGVVGRNRQSAGTKAYTSAQAIPAVSVVSPTASPGARSLSLPGALQAYYNAPIYSRVSGYVHGLVRRHRRAGEGGSTCWR